MYYTYEFIYIITNIIYIFIINKLFHVFFNKNVCNNKLKIKILFLFYLCISVIIFITKIPIIIFILNIIFLFLISLSYDCSIQKKLLSILFIYSVCLIIEILAGCILGFLEFSPLIESSFESIPELVFIRVLVLIVVHIMSRYKFALNQEYSLPNIYFLALFIVLCGTLYLFLSQLSIQNINTEHIIISSIILITVNITMVFLDEKIYRVLILEYEKVSLKQQNEALEKQMEVIYESSESIRILKHDFKNHLIMLSSLYKNGDINEMESYIDSILENIDNQVFANSNNFVIDSIINYKLNNIKNSDIKINVILSIPSTFNIKPHDLTIIIANLLDNAIFACERSKEKTLDIKIASKMDTLMISICNSYNGIIINENGNFKTTKLNKNNHGLGITSIHKILKKYDGEVRFEYNNDIFYTFVIIPY